MRWAEQDTSVALDAEDRVPRQIATASDEEQADPERPEPITGWDGGDATPSRHEVAAHQPADPGGGGQETGVQGGMPWGEEGFQFGHVVVGPDVGQEAAEQPGAERDGEEIAGIAGTRRIIDGREQTFRVEHGVQCAAPASSP